MNLRINGKDVSAQAGSTILAAAQSAGVKIPTLCHIEGYAHFTSCMICVVKELKSGKLLPSCGAPAADGMVIETESEEVSQARRTALSLLLSEHVGDCEGPCRTVCPAHMDIPLMIRLIAQGRMREAIEVVKADIALPAVLGRICPAPCEKGCRRGKHDAPVSICLLKRHVADVDLESGNPFLPVCRPATGRKVAVIGAGPAGLAAAYYLAQMCHECTVYDEHAEAGGQLRRGIPESVLPGSVVAAETDVIRKLGVRFIMKTKVGLDIGMGQLLRNYDAVALAAGKTDSVMLAKYGVAAGENGVKTDAGTMRTSAEKIFACGDVVYPGRMAVRAVAHGKSMAIAIDQYLSGAVVSGQQKRFESRIGRLLDHEMAEFLKGASAAPRGVSSGGAGSGFSTKEAVDECARCLHCDCRKAHECALRDLAQEYGAGQHQFKSDDRRRFLRNAGHAEIIYEPGKCIKCGICVRITERAREKYGMAFLGRGFDAAVEVPFGEELGAGLCGTAEECVKHCPTGALAYKEGDK